MFYAISDGKVYAHAVSIPELKAILRMDAEIDDDLVGRKFEIVTSFGQTLVYKRGLIETAK